MPDLLITGSHSFIGGAVQDRLRAEGGFHVETLSLRGDDWKRMDFSRFDSVLHAAGIAHISPDPALAPQYEAVNHQLTASFARKVRADGVKQFVFLSSMIVFGEASPAGVFRSITLDTPAVPANAYGQSKLDAENDLRRMEDESFRVAILRPPMVYGRGCKGNYNTLTRLAKRLPVFPEFENHRSILYVENLAELIRLILIRRDRGTFHPQDGDPVSVSDIVRAICAAHGKRMRFTPLLTPLVRLAGQRGMARRAFGDMAYEPAMSGYPENYRIVSFEEGIRRTEEGSPWEKRP